MSIWRRAFPARDRLTPSVVVVLVVKNAAEVLPGALQSLRDQTYKDFRVVAIDGHSTDGTLELLKRAAGNLRIKIRSEADRNLADGLAKGLRHAHGDIVGILCADERYLPDTIERAVQRLTMTPEAVAVCGPVQLIDRAGDVTGVFEPPPFEAEKHLSCEMVWPIAGTFFNRKFIGDELRYDDSAPTCPDYELWGRLGFLYHSSRFVRLATPVASAYADTVSMSFRPEAFDRMVADKQHHLHTLLAQSVPPEERDRLAIHASAGIYLWAAEQLHVLGAPLEKIVGFARRAADIDSGDGRIEAFFRTRGMRWIPETGEAHPLLPDAPGPAARFFAPLQLEPWPGVTGVSIADGELRTGRDPWGYSVYASFAESERGANADEGRSWALLDVEVVEGAAGFGVLSGMHFLCEHILTDKQGRRTFMLPSPSDGDGLMVIRSGGLGGARVLVHRAEHFIDPDDRPTPPQAQGDGE